MPYENVSILQMNVLNITKQATGLHWNQAVSLGSRASPLTIAFKATSQPIRSTSVG